MFERILLALDGSPASEAAVDRLLDFLVAAGSEVVLFSSIGPTSPTGEYVVEGLHMSREAVEKAAADTLARVAERWPDRSIVRTRIGAGDPARAILDAAREEDATAIAMATHGRSGIARLTMGSVAEKVLRAAEIPILLVRSYVDSPEHELVPAVLERGPFERILVPVDEIDRARDLADAVSEISRASGRARVDVLHVESLPPASDLPDAAGKAMLDEAVEVLRDHGIQAEGILRRGEVATAILATSAERQSDLVAIASQPRTGWSRWIRGSKAEMVLRHARVPLLVMPSRAGRETA